MLTSSELQPLFAAPKHRVIAGKIRAFIHERGMKAGDRLPSERQLAQELKVAHATVRLANDDLIREGWVIREHGRGTFVASHAGKTGESNVTTVGYLAVGDEPKGYAFEQYRTMEALALAANMRLIFGCQRPDDRDLLPRNFVDEGVGAFVVDGWLDEKYLERLRDVNMPYVIAGNHPPMQCRNCSQVRMDVSSLYQQVTASLAQAQHTVIWCVFSRLDLFYFKEMLAGYRRGLSEAGIFPELLLLRDGRTTAAVVEQIVRSMPRLGTRCAILLDGDVGTFARELEIARVDLSQIDVVTCSSSPSTLPWCSALPLPTHEIAKMAPSLLFENLKDHRSRFISFAPSVASQVDQGHVRLSVNWQPAERVVEANAVSG